METDNSNQNKIEFINQLPPTLKGSIESIVKSEGFITYKVSYSNLCTNSGSFMGILYEVDIKGKTANGDKELNIFVKNRVENEQINIYSVSELYRREVFWYKELSRIFVELQDEVDIPCDERFKMAKSYEQCNPKSIILEHLAKRGFKTYDRMETVPVEYAKRSIEQLAKLHALSKVIQVKRPEFFNVKIVTLKQPFVFKEDWHGLVKNMYNYSINRLEPHVREKVAEKILEKIDDYSKYMNDTSGVCTICHGDYKLNNVMAKEANGRIEEVIPIDFQILHYGCPILDFLYFIFNGTDQEFRRNHLSALKDLYYETMSKFLRYFELDIEKIFSRTEFERVYKEKLEFGLIINVFYVPFLFAAEDDTPDVAHETLSTLSFKVDERFTKRFRGVVNDFIQWGYL